MSLFSTSLIGRKATCKWYSVWQYQVLVLCFGDFDSYPKMMFVNAFIYLHSELIQRSIKDWFFEGPESTVSLKTGELVAWGPTWWIYRWVSLPKLIAYCVRFELVESSTSKNTTYLLYIGDYTTNLKKWLQWAIIRIPIRTNQDSMECHTGFDAVALVSWYTLKVNYPLDLETATISAFASCFMCCMGFKSLSIGEV